MRVTATLFKRNGIYYLKWPEFTGDLDESGHPACREVRLSLRTGRRDTALKIQAAKNDELIRSAFGVPIQKPKFSPARAWERYTAFVEKAPTTLETEVIFWDQFFEFCPVTDITAVRRHHVLDWRKSLLDGAPGRRPNQPRSVNNKVRTLSGIFNHLRHAELIDQNPFADIKGLDEGGRKVKFHPWESVQRCLDLAAEAGRDIHLVFILGALAGLRHAEILLQRWEYIDWESDRFSVRGTKTAGSTDVIHLNPTLRAALEPYREASGWIVAPQKEPGQWRYRWDFRKPYKAVVTAAGIPDADVHSLRHSFATHLLDLGYTRAQVGACLRHSALQSTDVYADVRGVKAELGAI